MSAEDSKTTLQMSPSHMELSQRSGVSAGIKNGPYKARGLYDTPTNPGQTNPGESLFDGL
jgi:hypothetical protein